MYITLLHPNFLAFPSWFLVRWVPHLPTNQFWMCSGPFLLRSSILWGYRSRTFTFLPYDWFTLTCDLFFFFPPVLCAIGCGWWCHTGCSFLLSSHICGYRHHSFQWLLLVHCFFYPRSSRPCCCLQLLCYFWFQWPFFLYSTMRLKRFA